MTVVETIAPIFLIIIFGYVIQQTGLLSGRFVEEANRFVFSFSLPFLIYTSIVRSDIKDVSFTHIMSVIAPTFAVLCVALVLGSIWRLKNGRLGTFIQTTFHGNVTYIGLAVLFYMVGEQGLKKGAILIGFLILVNNALAIGILSWTSQHQKNMGKALLSIIRNPVIIATFLGIMTLYARVPIPGVLSRSMGLLANIALPLALIVIGASITVDGLRESFGLSAMIAVLKLIALPGLSVLFCRLYSIPLTEGFPGIILLATPTATTSYIFAREIGGDAELASHAVTLSTLISPATFVFWAYMAR
jgi:malate permease and related proteins